MKISGMIKTALVSVVALTASAAFADDEGEKKMSRSEKAVANFYEKYEETGKTKRCVQASRIDSTRALSDGLIYFDMRGKKDYVNKLPRKCHGLYFENRFMYKLHGSSLCNMDFITVLDGFGRERMTCGLDDFVEVKKKPKDKKDKKDSKTGE